MARPRSVSEDDQAILEVESKPSLQPFIVRTKAGTSMMLTYSVLQQSALQQDQYQLPASDGVGRSDSQLLILLASTSKGQVKTETPC